MFLEKLQLIAQLSRDLCFFTIDLFSGDRSSDLSRVLCREVLDQFPILLGYYFTIRLGKLREEIRLTRLQCVVAKNLVVCPVKNFERYTAVANSIKINLGQGLFLFRVTKCDKVAEKPFTGSAVHGRLKFCLDQIQANDGETPYSSCSIVAAP